MPQPRNVHAKYLTDEETALGPGAGVATITVTFDQFRHLERVRSVRMSGGYIALPGAPSDNRVVITPYYAEYTAGADGPLIAVPAAVDLSGETITVEGEGW